MSPFITKLVLTGGTINGIGKMLKKEILGIKIYAVEPKDSPVLSGGAPGSHKLAGMGAGFIPEVLNTHIYDIETVEYQDAIDVARKLARGGNFSGYLIWCLSKCSSGNFKIFG